MSQMKWTQVTVTTTQEASEAIANRLFELGATGVEVKDEATLIAYFPMDDRVGERIRALRQFISRLAEFGIDAAHTAIALRSIEDDNWAESWKSAFPPLRIGKRFLIVPTWVDVTPQPSEILLRLDPGMAFGTGQHATTRLSLELLELAMEGGERVADIGTGSGVLAIAAAKLGASHIDAVDVDPTVLPIAKRNFETNGVASIIRLLRGDGLLALEGEYDLILANILAKVILPMIPDFRRYLRPRGRLILSGISTAEVSQIEGALEANVLQIAETRQQESWVGILARYTKQKRPLPFC